MSRLFAAFCFLIFFAAEAQNTKTRYVKFPTAGFFLYENYFTILNVEDARPNPDILGTIDLYDNNKPVQIALAGGNKKAITDLLNQATAYAQPNSFQIFIRIDELDVSASGKGLNRSATVELALSYFIPKQEEPFYSNRTVILKEASEADDRHADRLMTAFQVLLLDLNYKGIKELKQKKQAEETEYVPTPSEDNNHFYVHEEAAFRLETERTKSYRDSTGGLSRASDTRHVFAVGYQLGGFSLIGFETEIRLNNLFGINFGLGYLGYTAGIKLHTSPTKNSLFVHPNFKDGGFGQFGTFNLEVGGRIPLSRNNSTAIHLQGGLGRINYISQDLSNRFKGAAVGNVTFVIGVGLSW